MKKLIVMAAMAIITALWAAEVTPEQAQTAAQNWVRRSPKRMTALFSARDAHSPKTSRDKDGKTLYHVVEMGESGFVVTSGDTELPPVIAFSASGTLDLSDADNPLVAMLEQDLAYRNSQLVKSKKTLRAAQTSTGSGASFEDEWASLLTEPTLNARSGGTTLMKASSYSYISDVRVEPMVQSKWGQSKWNGSDTFNYYTPSNYVCGCVATAAAQIMRYWQWPSDAIAAGTYDCWVNDEKVAMTMMGGFYDWSSMPLTSSDCSTEAQRQAIGKLLYDVGVASQMKWASNESGTRNCVAGQALRNRFGYASAHSYCNGASGTLEEANLSWGGAFSHAILASLDAGMPVAIAIHRSSGGGHAVVVDGYGYDGSSYVYCHINCGWNGSEDAWYDLIGEGVTSSAYTELRDVSYNIHPTISGDVISGRVLDSYGPVSNATVTLTTPSGSQRTATTNAKGIYSFRADADATYTVVASSGSLTSAVQNVTLPSSYDTEWTITNKQGGASYYSNPPSDYPRGKLGNKWGVDLLLDVPAATCVSISADDWERTIVVSWTNVVTATSYNIYRSTTNVRPISPIRTGLTKTSFVDYGTDNDYAFTGSLKVGVKYYYWVEAVNSVGSSFSDMVWKVIPCYADLRPERLVFGADGGTASIVVRYANASWIATTPDSWLSLSTNIGDFPIPGNEFDGTIMVTAAANTTVGDRTGRVIVTVGAETEYPLIMTNVVTQGISGPQWTIDEDGVLTDVELNSAVSVAIPSTVTAIGDSVFSGCSGLTSVTIPNSVTSIGSYAFRGCSGLTSVSIPNSVTNIGSYAFSSCSGLTSVTIPNSVTNIGWRAFEGCSRLTSVTIPDSVTSISDFTFSECESLTSVTIPNSVTHIGEGAFEGCREPLFDTTTISGVTLVDGWAVGITESLSGNLVLTGVRGIGDYAFAECYDLTSVMIGTGVTSIGDYAFAECYDLTSVMIGTGVTSIGEGAFAYCENLASVTIPDSVTSIGCEAFLCCEGLASVVIGVGVTDIGEDAFVGCIGLQSFAVAPGNSRYKVVSGLLLSADGSELVAVPGSVDLTSVTIPDGVLSIGHGMFRGYSDLESVTIAGSVTNIGESAFRGCSSLTDVTISSGVIGSMAFYGCGGLTNIVIRNGVEEVGFAAFAGCVRLKTVSIGNGVTSLDDYAFVECNSLASVKFYGNAPNVGVDAFRSTAQGCTVFVLQSSTGWGVDIPGTWNGMRIEYLNGVDGTVTVDIGGGTSITVPEQWIDSHPSIAALGGDKVSALLRSSANGRKVWECYVVGLNPEDSSATNDFKITSFPLKADGTPDIEHIVFDPPQARWNVPGARAVIKGAAALGDAWQEVTEQNKASFRFFKVTVELP